MHLYKMFRPFVNEDIEITNNYVLSRKDNNYHFLLFNKINDRYMSDVKQDFIFHNELPQDSLMIIKTLNHEHGSDPTFASNKRSTCLYRKRNFR